MSAEDLEKYETEMELQLYREYRDVVGLFTHVVETERRFYLTNQVELNVRTSENGEVFFEVTMQDAWVWDMYRPARFVKNVKVVTFKDVNIEELARSDFEVPDPTEPDPRLERRRAGAAPAPGNKAPGTDNPAKPVHSWRILCDLSTAVAAAQRARPTSCTVDVEVMTSECQGRTGP